MIRTQDRALSDIYTVEKLGRTQEMTPEGFLLCRDVPIARTGEMLYGAGEVPVKVGRDGVARVTRDESVLMSPDTLASFEGKAITIDHPEEDVNPSNWRELSKGFTRNVRVGDNGQVLADLLITDEDAISQVREGLREVSCGYDAEYEDQGGGRGRQVSIIGNHVALVKRGRCGPVCSIGDSEMSTKTRDWKSRLRGFFLTGDEEGFVNELKGAPDVAALDGDPPDSKTHNITINLQGAAPAAEAGALDGTDGTQPGGVVPPADPMAAVMAALGDIQNRLTALEGGGKPEVVPDPGAEEDVDPEDDVDEDGDGDGDPTNDSDDEDEDERMTTDSASLQTEFADVVARAEILSPGIKLPTFDAKSDPKKTSDSICALRRRSLARVADEHTALVAPLLQGLDLKKSTCDSVRVAFVAASEMARKANTDRQYRISRPVRDSSHKGVPTIAEIQAKHDAVWAKTRAS